MIPIVLSTSVQVPVNTWRGPPDETRLKNPFDGPMFIDELRIRATDDSTWPFASLRVYLRLGQHILVNQVHTWLLARRRNPSVSTTVQFNNVIDTTTTADQRLMTWRFKTPIWVERGQQLEINLGNTDDTALSNTIIASVAYVGRSATEADRPRIRKLPWATSFVGVKRGSPLDTNTLETSKRTDLFNPANSPMRIQRLVGRIYTTTNTGTSQPDVLFRYTTIRMIDQGERIVVRDDTPFSHLLDYEDRVLSVNSILPPFGYYTLYLKEQFASVSAAGVFLPYVGMIGEYAVPAFDRI